MAAIRGDTAQQSLWAEALALVQAHQISSETELHPLVQQPPPGTSSEVVRQLRYVYEAGGWVLVESALADLPCDLRWLFESGAVTIEQLVALHRTLGITAAADLAAELRREAVRRVPGLDPAVEAAVAGALEGLRSSRPRIPLGRAMALAEPFLACLRAHPDVVWAEPAGSLRRGQDSVGDIEIVAPASNPTQALDAVLALDDVTRCLHRGPRRVYVLADRVQVGVRSPQPEAAGAALLHLTGSCAHVDGLRALAAERGWRLEPEGLEREPGATPVADAEPHIYAALGLPWIPPEIRNGDDELEAARHGTLPSLVAQADIRGDLHMHTDFSDGRDTVEGMVAACVALGYEYLAITDHSPRSSASRNLSAESVIRQRAQIADLRQKYPSVTIFHGCEVDILPDGRLDFSDRVLETFDIVLASLHEGEGQTPEQLMQRYLAALGHPLVSAITHPTNRLIPYRRGYDLDYDRLFAAAAETGTLIEVDGAPAHLDLDGALARRAVAAGAMLIVSSDCHRADMLARQMQLGILTARRGWVEPRHVLNTRSVGDVRAALTAKRT